MPRLFSFASWNVENLSGADQDRIERVVGFINGAGPDDAADADGNSPPDVFSIQEVTSSSRLFTELVNRVPTHQFFITVMPGVRQGILVGVNRRFTAYYEQRTEFQAGQPTLRPGALVTIVEGGVNYSLLFVHLKAFSAPVGWGLRDDMIEHIRNLKRAMDGTGPANLIALGDFNTVGLNVTFSDNDMSGAEEVARFDRVFNARDMSLIAKDHEVTLWNGPGSSFPPANVDHAFASDHLDIRHSADATGLRVLGWPELPTPEAQGEWIDRFSDHALLYGEVHVP